MKTEHTQLGHNNGNKRSGHSPIARAFMQASAAHLKPQQPSLADHYGKEAAAMLGVGGGDIHHPCFGEVDYARV